MFVRGTPRLSLRRLIKEQLFSNEKSAMQEHYHSTLNGRTALLQILQKLKIAKTTPVIVPAFICDTVFDYLVTYGYQVILVDIDKNFNLDQGKLTAVLENNFQCVVVFVNFFGKLADISVLTDLKNKYNFLLIEDACHFFCNSHFETKQQIDAVFFSMKKTAPCFFGGLYRTRTKVPHLLDRTIGVGTTIELFSKLLFKEMILRVCEWLNLNLYAWRKDFHERKKPPLPIDLNAAYDTRWVSYLVDRFTSVTNLGAVLSSNKTELKRQLNYRARERLLTSDFYTVFAFHVSQHDIDVLLGKGIPVSRWPGVDFPAKAENVKDFPVANFVNENIAFIQNHQSLGKKQIKHIAETINDLA